MEFLYFTLLMVWLINLACIAVMFLVQELVDEPNLPAQGQFIKGSQQRFLYLQDYHSTTWGYVFGISLIMGVFVHLATNGLIGVLQWILFVVIMLVIDQKKWKERTNANRKPDWIFPETGKISYAGILHVFYYSLSAAVTLVTAIQNCCGNVRGPVRVCAILGCAIYGASWILDKKAGHFAPFRKS